MSDTTVAQLIAGVILIEVAGFSRPTRIVGRHASEIPAPLGSLYREDCSRGAERMNGPVWEGGPHGF